MLKLSSLLGIDIDKEAANSRDVVSEATKDAFQSLTLEQQDELRSIADKINERRRTLSDESISNKESNLKENSKMSEKFYEVDLDALREAIETLNDLSTTRLTKAKVTMVMQWKKLRLKKCSKSSN